MSNYRMWAYAMIATGLLNWDYQRAQPHVVSNSLAIVLPGLILLGLTYAKAAHSFLISRAGKISWLIIGIAALGYGFLNK